MNESRANTSPRSPVPPWDGRRLSAAFASRRDRSWTLGYASVGEPSLASETKWSGSFPRELEGTLFRNGPARHELGGMRYAHRWDGDGMIQRFALSEAGVKHSGRFIQTHKLRAEDEAGQMIYSGFGTPVDRAQPTPQRIEDSNPANINVVRFNTEYLALWEAGRPYRFDPDTLATIGTASWLEGQAPAPSSAHPKIDAQGNLWNFGVDPLNDRLIVYCVGPSGTLQWKRELEVPQIAPAHDFAVTDRYLVFLMHSIVCNRDRLMNGASFAESCQWLPDLGMRALLVDKRDAAVRQYQLPPGCLFHVANAWESAGTIHIHYLRSADPSSLIAGWTVMAGEYRHSRGAALTHARLDLSSNAATQEAIFDHEAEFPSLLAADVGRENEYLLCLERSTGRPGTVPGYDQFALLNLRSGARSVHNYGDDWMVEEHLLIADPGSSFPRWAVGTALDLHARATTITVFAIDGDKIDPLAQARLPYALPLGLHGTFVRVLET